MIIPEIIVSARNALDEALRKEGWRTRDFETDFALLVDKLAGAYSLDPEIYSPASALGRSVAVESLNQFQVYLRSIKRDQIQVEEVVGSCTEKNVSGWFGRDLPVPLGDLKIHSKKIVDLGINSTGSGVSEVLAVLAHRGAMIKTLLGHDGINQTHATAWMGATEAENMVKDAARIAYNWNRDWGSLTVEHVMEKVKQRVSGRRIKTAVLTGALALFGCQTPEVTTPVVVEPQPTNAVEIVGNPTQIPDGVPTQAVESEAIKADTEFVFLEGKDFQAMRKVFEESQVSKYEGGVLVQGLTGTEIGFVPLTFARFSVNGKDDGRVMGMGEMGGQQAFVIMDERDGLWHHMAEFSYPGYPQFRDWGLWMGSDGTVPVGFSDGAVPVQIFGTESDLNTGEVVRFLYFDQNGEGHEIKGRGASGKVAMPEESEIWYLVARDMIHESPNPSEWSWKYAEDGTLNLIRKSDKEYVYVWEEESDEWIDSELAGLPRDMQEFGAIPGNTIDLTDGIAYDAEGNVHWAKGENGEWINYPGGVMTFPARDGSGAPDLQVPYFRDFNSMVTLFSSDFPWNDMGVNKLSREKDEDRLRGSRYIMPYVSENPWIPIPIQYVRIHKTEDPSQWANAFVGNFMLHSGRMVTSVVWRSSETDLLTEVFVDVDAMTLAQELAELNVCYGDMGASPDAKCETDIVIPGVNEN